MHRSRKALVLVAVTWALPACGSSSTAPPSDVSPDAASEASPAVDGGPDAARDAIGDAELGAPIAIPGEAPYDKWTWIDVPEARCAKDTPTGIGINPSTKSKRLVIFFDGGGSCWGDDNCAALNLDGYGATEFAAWVKASGTMGILDRTDAANPLADASFVFVPYCTGDLHAGNKVTTYPKLGTLHHLGYPNYTYFLRRIAPTFREASSVVIAGASAGGGGALWNYARTHDLFAPTRVFLVDDSGPQLRPPYYATSIAETRRTVWGLDGTTPKGCKLCNPTDGYWNIQPFLVATYPDFRGSILDSRSDALLAIFLGLDSPTVTAALSDLEAAVTSDHFKFFFVAGDQHGFVLTKPPSAIVSSGVSYADFLRQELSDDPAWKNVDP